MAREVIVKEWCDACLGFDRVKAEATWSQVVAIDRLSRLLALCDKHHSLIIQPLLDALEYGAQPDRGPAVDLERPHRCPVCEKGYPTRNGLGHHLRRMHAKTLGEVGAELEPMLPEPEPDKPYRCPECSRSFASPQGLGAHRYQVHGVTKPQAASAA